MSNIKIFDYDGVPISFEFTDGNKMINATQMAKPFKKNKQPSNFLRTQNTKEFILALEADFRSSDMRNGTKREVLRVVQGGDSELQGTWMHELLVIKFAGWLNPSFEIWMQKKIRELLTTGRVEMDLKAPMVNEPAFPTPSDGIIKGLRIIVEQLEEQ